MKLEVINLHNKIVNDNIIVIDRKSVLGNPFVMSIFAIDQIGERNRVCDAYQKFFDKIINKYKFNLRMTDFEKQFIRKLYKIYQLSKTQDVYLGCWCWPKRCHGDTIVSFIQNDADKIFEGGLKWK